MAATSLAPKKKSLQLQKRYWRFRGLGRSNQFLLGAEIPMYYIKESKAARSCHLKQQAFSYDKVSSSSFLLIVFFLLKICLGWVWVLGYGLSQWAHIGIFTRFLSSSRFLLFTATSYMWFQIRNCQKHQPISKIFYFAENSIHFIWKIFCQNLRSWVLALVLDNKEGLFFFNYLVLINYNETVLTGLTLRLKNQYNCQASEI